MQHFLVKSGIQIIRHMPLEKINNINMHYKVTGTGEPILFIHGLGSTSDDWKYQVDYFSKSFQVITYDIRGHGRTEPASYNYSIPLFAEDCAALMNHLKLASAHIVGLSLGGCIAFQLAVSYPDRIKSLAIINSLPEVNLNKVHTRIKLYSRLMMVKLLGMRFSGKVLGKKLFVHPGMEAMRKTFAEKWAKNDKKAYSRSVKALIGWSVADHLHTLMCPVLFIASEVDYTPVALKEHYTKKIKNARLVMINGARHAVTWERPEEVNELLRVLYGR
jgi:pimeloyl-ACP methyl ester carboxylesterase